MQLLSILLFAAGCCCLLSGWLFSRPGSRKGPNVRLCRGIISKIENHRNASCILTISFSSPGGTISYHREQTQQSATWYEGRPLLIQYRYEQKNTEVVGIQTYQQAYGKAIVFLLAGVLLIIAAAKLL